MNVYIVLYWQLPNDETWFGIISKTDNKDL